MHATSTPSPLRTRLERFALLAALAAGTFGFVRPLPAQLPEKVDRQFVPVDQFQTILQRDREGVLLPRKEFEELWLAARANQRNRPQGAPALLVTTTAYRAEVRDRQLVVTAEIAFRQFEPGWQALPLKLSNLIVESAALGEEPARVSRTANAGELVFFHESAGDGVLTLTLATPLAAAGSDQVAGFGLIDSPVAALTVVVPAGKHLLLDEQALARPAEVAQPAEYVLAVGGRDSVRLRLTDRQDEQKTDRLVFVNSTIGVDASPGEITWQAVTGLQVFGASFNQVVLTVPKRLEIADVQSGGLEAWELADDPDDAGRTRITLNYRQPITGTRAIRVRGVLSMPSEEAWEIPLLSVGGATSHVGYLVVTHPRGVRIQFLDETSVRRSAGVPGEDPQKDFLAPIVDRPAPQIFEFWNEAASLQLVMRSRERELTANIQSVLDFQYETVRFANEVTLACRYAPLFEVDLELPVEWMPQQVRVAGETVQWQDVSEGADARRIRVALPQPLVPGMELKIQLEAVTELATWPPGGEAVSIALPQLKLPQAQLFDGRYFLSAHADFELTPTDLFGLNPVTFNADGERTAYEYQDTEIEGAVELTQRPTQLSASTLSFVRLEPRSLEAHLEAIVSAKGAGRRQWQVSLPESTGRNVRFVLMQSNGSGGWIPDAGLIEQTAAEPADGRIVWTLTTDRRLYGDFALFVQVTLPRAADSTEFTVPDLIVVGAERQHGVVAIEARPEQSLAFAATGHDKAPLREVDPANIPVSVANYLPRERIVAAFHAFRLGHTVQLTETRFDRAAVPTAVCRRMEIRSILGSSGRWQHEAVATFAAVGVQSLLVDLPDGAVLWATLLDGQPIEVRRVGTSYLIPLSGGVPGADRALRLFYNNDADALGSFGQVRQSPPRLAVDVLGEAQPLEILDQHWGVYSPDEILFVKNQGEFRQPEEFRAGGFLSDLPALFSRISWGHVWDVLIVALVVFLVLYFLDRALRRWSLGKTLTITALLIFIGCVLFALILPATQEAREAARRSYATNDMKQIGMAVDSPAPTAATAPMADYEMSEVTAEESLALPPPGGLPRPGLEGAQRIELELMKRPEEKFDVAKDGAPQAKPEVDRLDDLYRNQAAQTASPARPMSAEPRTREDRPMDEAEAVAAEEINLHGRFGAEGRVTSSRGARLSVDVALEVPAGHSLTTFRYYGGRQTFENDPLRVLYLNRQSSGTLTGLIVVITLGLAWMLRKRTALRLVALILGVVIPLALAGIAPAEVFFLLDGVLIGSMVGLGVLACCRCCCLPLCRKLCAKCCSLWTCKSQTTTAALLIALAWSGGAWADEGKSIAPDPDANPWTVIVPYDRGADPLSADKVFLNQKQFLELWKAAHPDQPLRREEAREGFVSGAAFVAELEPGQAGRGAVKITARLVLQQLDEGSRSIALPLGGVALESANLDGEPAAIETARDPSQPAYRVATTSAGTHVLDLVFRIPAQLAGEAGQFTLPLTGGVTGTLTFTLPGEKLNVRVNGATTAYRKTSDAAGERILVPLPETGAVTVAWTPPQMAAGVDRVIQAESQTDLLAADAGLSVRKNFVYRVRQGTVEELSFQLPAGWSLQTIGGPDVGGWQLEGDETARVLRVFLRRSVDETTQISFEMFRAEDIGSEPLEVTAPQIVPLEISRETGTVGLFAGPQFVLRAGGIANASRVDNDVFPTKTYAPSNAPLQMAYRYARPDFEVGFSILRKEREAKSVSQHGVSIGRTRSLIASRFQVDLTGAPRSRLSLSLPDEYIILDVQATSLEDWYQTESPEGGKLLILELPGPVTGAFEAAVTGYLPKEATFEEVDVLAPVLLDTSEDKTTLAVWGAETYRLSVVDSTGWKAIDAGQVSAALRQLQPQSPQLAFEATQILDRYLSVRIETARPELEADSVTVVNVTNTAIVYQLALRWQISQAPVEKLSFVTPDWMAGKLDFSDAPLLRNYSSERLEDGRIRWTVLLTQPVSTEFFLSPLAVVPVPEDNTVVIPRIVVERLLRFDEEDRKDVDRTLAKQRHFAVLINGSSSQLDVVDKSLLEPVAPDALPLRRENTTLQQATDVFRLRPERELPTWTMKLFEQRRGAEAIVNYADLTTILSRDGGWRMRATYLIRNRTRQFLPVRLPEGARLLSAFVRDQPVRPVTTKVGEAVVHLFPLPKASAADLSFTVVLTLAGRLPQGELVRGFDTIPDKVDLPAPDVLAIEESASLGVPVARTRWTVWVPDGLSASEVEDISRTNLSPQRDAEAEIELRLAQLKEANDLLLSVEGKTSLGVQMNAVSNVELLQRDLESTLSSLQSYSGDGSDKLRALRDEQLKLGDNYRRVESNLARQTDAAERGDYDVLLNENLKNLGEFTGEQQLLLLQRGNRLLYDSNSATITNGTVPQSPNTSLNFDFNIQVQQAAEEDAKQQSQQPQAGKKGAETEFRKRLSNEADNRFYLEQQQLNAPAQEPSRTMERGVFDDLSGNRYFAPQGRAGVADGRQSGLAFQQGSPLDPDDLRAKPGRMLLPLREADWERGRRSNASAGQMGGFAGDPLLWSDAGLEGQAAWTSTSGLSLDMDLPAAGYKLTFAKVGGAPRLALSIQPDDAWSGNLQLLWFVVWTIAALFILRVYRSGAWKNWSCERIALGAAIGGVILAILLPGLAVVGLLIAAGAGISIVVDRYKSQPKPEPATAAPTAETGGE